MKASKRDKEGMLRASDCPELWLSTLLVEKCPSKVFYHWAFSFFDISKQYRFTKTAHINSRIEYYTLSLKRSEATLFIWKRLFTMLTPVSWSLDVSSEVWGYLPPLGQILTDLWCNQRSNVADTWLSRGTRVSGVTQAGVEQLLRGPESWRRRGDDVCDQREGRREGEQIQAEHTLSLMSSWPGPGEWGQLRLSMILSLQLIFWLLL